jgi:tRNA A-37 threonylcarbamoyl transferase component Bud32
MNPVTRPKANAGTSQSTTSLGTAAAGTRTPPRRCLALVPGTTSQVTDELHCLLRRRLRVAGLIGLAGLAIFFVKSLVAPNSSLPAHSVHLAIHASVVALMTVLCSLLWTRIPLTMKKLRLIELGLFGSMALFFAYLQVQRFQNAELIELATQGNHEKLVASLSSMSNSLRWFVLLVLYGTFIPNTWKRCAAVVGVLIATPIVLTLVSGHNCPIMSAYLAPAIFDMSVVLCTGGAIAIFGSYRIQELQEEAMQARKLGQYRLVRRLGGGGMGEVFLGEHMLLRRDCAIKLIRPDQAGDPTNLSRFEREVQTMATLTHWNTVEIYDYGHAADGTFYYVMEYLPGLTLQELIDRYGPLPPGRAIHFLRQLCAALREAHAIGLIHRDIKPNNVIACERGGVSDVAKLLDFGLVVHQVSLPHDSDANKLTVQGTILGSPPFISPEQAMGKNQVDRRADIYSLGGLGYFLLTGQPPFVRDTAMELLVAHLREPVTPLHELRPDVPHDLEEVILKCLSKNPDERYDDATCLDKALAACAAAGNWDNESAEAWWSQSRTEATTNERMPEAVTVGQS